MANDKLLPCPFCGGEVEYWSCDRLIQIECKVCKYHRLFNGLISNKKTDVPVVYKGGIVSDTEFYNRYATEEAIASWNTRKPMEWIVEHLEEKKWDIHDWRDKWRNEIIGECIDVVKGGVDNEID